MKAFTLPKYDRVRPLLQLSKIHKGFDIAAEALTNYLCAPICEGCGKCCEINVPHCYAVEGSYAVSHLLGGGKLKRALDLAEGWLLEHHSRATIYEGMPFGVVDPKVLLEYNSLKDTKCPFLVEDKTCAIYECRPLACRAYGITRAAGPICKRARGVGEVAGMRVTVPVEAEDIIRKAVEGFVADLPGTLSVDGFAPVMLFRAADRTKLMKYVADNRIASAKLIGSPEGLSILWQEQAEAEAGLVPDFPAALDQLEAKWHSKTRRQPIVVRG